MNKELHSRIRDLLRTIMGSHKGSIGSLNNVYLPQLDRYRVDQLWKDFDAEPMNEDTSRAQDLLRQEADKYQLPDGSPGPLAHNCWGWRNIAELLRKVADKLDYECKPCYFTDNFEVAVDTDPSFEKFWPSPEADIAITILHRIAYYGYEGQVDG